MKKFKNGDKVKIPTIGTACIRTSLEEIQKSLFDYKLDYLYVCNVWEDGEIGLMRGDGKVFEQDLYHERDLEHYAGYGKTLKVGDKVKVTGNKSNSAFKLHGKICTICEIGEHYYGLEEEIPLKIDFGGVHHHEVELIEESDDLPDNMDAGDLMYGKEEYNETFNPEAHINLIIDFDKVETIEEIAQRHSDQNHIIGDFYKLGFIEGVKWCKEQLKN